MEKINEEVWKQAEDLIHREIKDPTERQIQNKYEEIMKKQCHGFAEFVQEKVQEHLYQEFKDSRINKYYK